MKQVAGSANGESTETRWTPQHVETITFPSGLEIRYCDCVNALRAGGQTRPGRDVRVDGHRVWPLLSGRGQHGEFPLVIAGESFRRRGYTVWYSEPELPDDDPDFVGFVLVSYPGKREQPGGHEAHRRMRRRFGDAVVDDLNRRADGAKGGKGKRGGGDPDLFVFNHTEQFFVEVKWRDHITPKQEQTFPLIESMLSIEIKLARIYEEGHPSKARRDG